MIVTLAPGDHTGGGGTGEHRRRDHLHVKTASLALSAGSRVNGM